MKKITEYVKGLGTEFGKVTWPKKQELIRMSGIVLAMTLALSLLVGGYDFVIQSGYNMYNDWTAQFRVSSGSGSLVDQASRNTNTEEARSAITAELPDITAGDITTDTPGVTITPIEEETN